MLSTSYIGTFLHDIMGIDVFLVVNDSVWG